MKKIKKKKNKPKKKWSKQVGYFLFKHAIQRDFSSIAVDVFYKDEHIGILMCSNVYSNFEAYNLNIYYAKNFSELKMSSTVIGIAKCAGLSH